MQFVTLTGRVATDLEPVRTNAGHDVLKFSVVAKDNKGNQNFYNVSMFANRFRGIKNMVRVGATVTIVGAMRLNAYVNKEGTAVVRPDVDLEAIDIIAPAVRDTPKPETEDWTDDGEDLPY